MQLRLSFGYAANFYKLMNAPILRDDPEFEFLINDLRKTKIVCTTATWDTWDAAIPTSMGGGNVAEIESISLEACGPICEVWKIVYGIPYNDTFIIIKK